jgi:hypothetical protein
MAPVVGQKQQFNALDQNGQLSDPWACRDESAPGGIFAAHQADQLADFVGKRGPSGLAPPNLSGPEQTIQRSQLGAPFCRAPKHTDLGEAVELRRGGDAMGNRRAYQGLACIA